MSKQNYLRKREAVKTERKEEMGDEGVKVGGRVFSPRML